MSVFDDGPVLLDGPATMLAVLRELVGVDALTWRGQIDVWNTGESAVWRIELNDAKGNGVQALQGQFLALSYNRLLVLDADDIGV